MAGSERLLKPKINQATVRDPIGLFTPMPLSSKTKMVRELYE
jgi:hypothetical protein